MERISGDVGERNGSTITGREKIGLPSLLYVLGGAPIERNVDSTSGNSTQTVRYGNLLKFKMNLEKGSVRKECD